MIKVDNLTKTYKTKDKTINALDNISLRINDGEFIIIRGPSGCGKTTLLMTLGGMLHPSNGSININNQDLYKLNNSRLNKFRANNIGFVFQMFHLIPYLNIKDNILLSKGSGSINKMTELTGELINEFNLNDRIKNVPSQLSTGEKQRTAIARALLNSPKILLADEPTGNLDPENAEDVIKRLQKFHKSGGTVIIVTHGDIAAKYADRIISLKNGKLSK